MARPSYLYTVKDLTTGDIHKDLSCSEVSELTGIGKNKIGASVTPGRVCKGRYIITRKDDSMDPVFIEKKLDRKLSDELVDDWDEICLFLNPRARSEEYIAIRNERLEK